MDIDVKNFDYKRPYGIELEYNAFDNRDFKQFPLNVRLDELPNGIREIASIINQTEYHHCLIKGYHPTNNNSTWVIKPDSSCGIELCTPVSKGWRDLEEICEIVGLLAKDRRINADHRCSVHVHVDIADLDRIQIAKILSYWIKSEVLFVDAMPRNRKFNPYGIAVGMTDLIQHDAFWQPEHIIKNLESKYLSLTSRHVDSYGKKTVEFRLMGNTSCLNPNNLKNYVRLVVHFVEMSYNCKDNWSGFCWYEPIELFQMLGFMSHNLPIEMSETRNWFLRKMHDNIFDTECDGWKEVRKYAKKQIDELMKKFGLKFDLKDVQ